MKRSLGFTVSGRQLRASCFFSSRAIALRPDLYPKFISPNRKFISLRPEPHFAEREVHFAKAGPYFAEPELRFAEPEPYFAEREVHFAKAGPYFAEPELRFAEPEPYFAERGVHCFEPDLMSYLLRYSSLKPIKIPRALQTCLRQTGARELSF